MHSCSIDEDLHGLGLYKTSPRHQILELFKTKRPWSTQEISKSIHAISRSTIYRTIRLLIKEGVIAPLYTNGERTFYERAEQTHHDHLQCQRCTNLECVPCPVPQLARAHRLEVTGTCHACRTA